MIILSTDLDGDRCQNNYGLDVGVPATRFRNSDLIRAVEIFDAVPINYLDQKTNYYGSVSIDQLTLDDYMQMRELDDSVCPAEQMLLMVMLKTKYKLWKTPV